MLSIVQWIDLLMGFILVVTVLSSGFRRLYHLVRCLILQSVALSLVLVLQAIESGEGHLYFAALVTLVIKGILIPRIMYRVIAVLKIKREIEPIVSIPFSLLFSNALVFLSFYLTSLLPGHLGILESNLPIATSSILIGIFLMVTRTKALTQMIGFLIVENGIFIAGMSTTGMGILIELGILFELLIGAIIMGVMLFEINKTFNSINTVKLTTLKE